MSVTVKQINDICMKNKDLETLVKEQLQIIDDKILHSDKSIGNNYITHYLPVTMPGLVGIERQDAQRIVYSSIICSLEKRGFNIKIVLNESSTILYIAWKAELNQGSLETMNKIIKSKLVTNTELQKIISE